MRQITLIRHAKVDIKNPWIYSFELKKYLELYNSASIKKTLVDKDIKKLIKDANFIATSKLFRAEESLKLFNKEADL